MHHDAYFGNLHIFEFLPKQLASFLYTILGGSRKENTGTIGLKREARWAKEKGEDEWKETPGEIKMQLSKSRLPLSSLRHQDNDL